MIAATAPPGRVHVVGAGLAGLAASVALAEEGTPVVLYDTTVDGRPRKGIAVLRTDGYLFLLDRVDGSPLLPIEERPVPQDPYQMTFPTQPFPVGGDQVVPNCVEPWLMAPGFKSGCYFTPLNQPNLMVPCGSLASIDPSV